MAFGRPIVEFPLVAAKLVGMAVRTYAVESLVYRLAGMLDARLHAVEGGGSSEAARAALEEYAVECSIAKVLASEELDWVVDELVQLHGGYGYIEDYPAAKGYRDARINRIWEGTNEINRLLIPGTLLRRAMKGRLDLLGAARRAQEALLAPSSDEAGDGPLAAQAAQVDAARQVTLLVAGAAVQRFGTAIEEQQEVLAAVADLVIQTAAMDSAVARARQAASAAGRTAAIHADLAALFVAERLAQVEAIARAIAPTVADGDDARLLQSGIRRLLRSRTARPGGDRPTDRRFDRGRGRLPGLMSWPAPDPWTGADAYESFVGRWGRAVARTFVPWLGAARGGTWVDVGCGTGALSGTIIELATPGRVLGVDPSEPYLARARQAVPGPVAEFRVGEAAALPVADRSVDAVVAALVLNFVPDVPAALAEWRRALRAGGLAGAYVWDYAAGMEMLRRFWDAAVALDPGARELDEGVRFPITRQGGLGAAFHAAGFTRVETRPIDVPTRFTDFDDLWRPFLGGQGPGPGYVATLDPVRRDRLRVRLRATLPSGPDGSIDLTARAWAVRAVRP